MIEKTEFGVLTSYEDWDEIQEKLNSTADSEENQKLRKENEKLRKENQGLRTALNGINSFLAAEGGK